MPERDIHPILQEAAADVLETMFFTAAAPQPSLDPPAGIPAAVRFSGTNSGVLTVSVEECAARTIAGNFLGVEEAGDLDATRVGEVVCEMTNMLCGSLLSRWNANGEYTLGAPRLGERHPPPYTAACVFDTGAGSIFVALSILA